MTTIMEHIHDVVAKTIRDTGIHISEVTLDESDYFQLLQEIDLTRLNPDEYEEIEAWSETTNDNTIDIMTIFGPVRIRRAK